MSLLVVGSIALSSVAGGVSACTGTIPALLEPAASGTSSALLGWRYQGNSTGNLVSTRGWGKWLFSHSSVGPWAPLFAK